MDTLRARCAVVAPAFLAVLATGALAGTNPGPDECWAEMVRLSKVHGVPAPLIAAVAHAESSWQQFARATGNYAGRYYNEGDLVESFDGGIGMMQITGDPISGIDHDRIRTDWKYNLEIGVRTLRFKYDYSWYVVSVINPRHGLPAVPNWFPRGDPEILENWWYGLICYNGYSPASTVAEVYLARAENPGAYRLHASDVTLGRFFPAIQVTRPSAAFPGFFPGMPFVAGYGGDDLWRDLYWNEHRAATHRAPESNPPPQQPPPLPSELILRTPLWGTTHSGDVTFTWDDLSSYGVARYHFTLRLGSNVVYQAWPGGPNLTVPASAFPSAGDYYWRVQADVPGGPAGSALVRHTGPLTPPGAPVLVGPVNWQSRPGPAVDLVWQTPAGQTTDYEVRIYYWTGSAWKYYFTYTTVATSFRYWPQVHRTWYAWRVRGRGPGGTGGWSSWGLYRFDG